MGEINWGIFRAKFDGKEQKVFESLCYQLFCREFDQKDGISRYKNQPGIETEPIEFEGVYIGFQAKFYETRLSEHKKEIEDGIKTAKTDNPQINKIYFYLNEDFSPSSKASEKKPVYLKDIESLAKSLSLEIVWRNKSYFEIALNDRINKDLIQEYFSLEKGINDFILELNNHSLSILESIRSEIRFNNSPVKIDRSAIIGNLKSSLKSSPLVILSGEGGVGKTAVIKDFFEHTVSDPCFIFKAVEFNTSHINKVFENYGNFSLEDFANYFDETDKFVVIDSAENLVESDYPEVFQHFLSSLLLRKWKIIFTSRQSYIDDLKFQFVEIYHQNFHIFDIEKLSLLELQSLSKLHGFNLPQDERLLKLINKPFYLNEYLQIQSDLSEETNPFEFRNILWNKLISKSSFQESERAKCFLSIAATRAETGNFFITSNKCEEKVLNDLRKDEIIKYDSLTGKDFITHDIYEEWALEKIIDRAFHNSESNLSFFSSVGNSLPIRRAFRNWLSQNLIDNRNNIKSLIENSFIEPEIPIFWKDEILIAVLLSNYSENFFQMFENILLEDNQKLLMRVIFLLRIGCKEFDEKLVASLDLNKADKDYLKTVFTKPKGNGWHSIIAFLNKHKNEIGISKIEQILPVIKDWTEKHKTGVTARNAGQIALYYYYLIIEDRNFQYTLKKAKESLIETLIASSSELINDIKTIFEEVVLTKQKTHTDKHHDLIKRVLSPRLNMGTLVEKLPSQILDLAELFWFESFEEKREKQRKRSEFGYSSSLSWESEDYFCISQQYLEYHPSSAYQTPILLLLYSHPKKAVDFILSFTNRTVGCYIKSKGKDWGEDIQIFLDKNEIIKQYIDIAIWTTYRGTQQAPNVLESIHMALENWLLGIAKNWSSEITESWCLYLIKNSKSASITSVVASVVLANPEKFFNLAKILFKTRELFFYDNQRRNLDDQAKSLFSIGHGWNPETIIYSEERLKTCDDHHRRISLEDLAFSYQIIQFGDEEKEKVEQRQKVLEEIFDKHYSNLPRKEDQTEMDKLWRICLGRMDKRHMTFEIENHGDKKVLKSIPKLETELLKMGEQSRKEYADSTQFMPLYLWAKNKFNSRENNSLNYEQYDNVQTVLSDLRELVGKLKKSSKGFYPVFDLSTPAYVCAVLLRDYFEELESQDKEFCKNIIVDHFFNHIYPNKIPEDLADIEKPVIGTLPTLIAKFPEHSEQIKSALLQLLLKDGWKRSPELIIKAIQNMWQSDFNSAQSLFLGYLLLKPKYVEFSDNKRGDQYRIIGITSDSEDFTEEFRNTYLKEIENIITNQIIFDLVEITSYRIDILLQALEFLPLNLQHETHKEFLRIISPIFSERLFEEEKDSRRYSLPTSTKQRFLRRFAPIVLNSSKSEISNYLKPFTTENKISELFADLFEQFTYAQIELHRYEEFWFVWSSFFEKVVDFVNNFGGYYYTKKIVSKYLFADIHWWSELKEWDSLKDREKLFLKKITDKIGHYPSAFYALLKILDGIGSNFVADGITWLSNILQKNENLTHKELEDNTIYYLENIVRTYSLKNRQVIKRSTEKRNQLIVILNFLVEKGSITGYLIREDTL